MTWPAKITPNAAPASISAVQLATVKTELGITDSSEDTKINRLIAAVSVSLSGPEGLDREYWRQDRTEDHAGRGGELLPLSVWPIETVASVAWDGSTVTASEYSIVPPLRRELYRSDGWNLSDVSDARRYHRSIKYQTAYIGGWWMPDQEPAGWAASTAYTAGDFVKSTASPRLYYFEATVGGTSDATEPTWPTTEDGTVADNDITWTARGGSLLPSDLQEAALIQVMGAFNGGWQAPAGIAEHWYDGARIRYRESSVVTLMPAVSAMCSRYR